MKLIKGENDLLTVNPALAKEWNYEKNGTLTPDQVTEKSHKKVWWMCDKGHEWNACISNRSVLNSGCPICANKQVLQGYNDLLTLNPTLAKEWNYEKNGTLTPDQVTAKSGKKVWWKCDKGHEWETVVVNRTRGHGCPICANKQVLQGYNDLLTLNPTLAKEWNFEKNGTLTPDQVTEKSHKKVWWKCDMGHEWETWVIARTKGRGCPFCAGRRRK